MFGAKLLQEGVKWRVGDSCQVNFWIDDWVPNLRRLLSYVIIHLSSTQIFEKVYDYISHDDWEIQKLKVVLPWHIIHRIVSIHAGRSQSGTDRAIWGLTNSGEFSVKSEYVSLFRNNVMPHWERCFMWRLRIPPRCNIFFGSCFMVSISPINIELREAWQWTLHATDVRRVVRTLIMCLESVRPL
ncbi:hypothetical protein Dsin_014986 [Dipteronia sinensis]|uniref:Reverse transcriptase zinc-binding domain-containing protein n=1 Tax=Dipteronia sinensis TaxID=43782 RepID=A0AAE0EAE7_9ROSI|nr:hypothetical protein Dsin_014986 [Dipteronia sinensis]